jgi:hypothetical protein
MVGYELGRMPEAVFATILDLHEELATSFSGLIFCSKGSLHVALAI